MYKLSKERRETHKMLDPFENAISKNIYYSAGFAPFMHVKFL